MLCDEQEAAQALGGLGAAEGVAERFGYLAGVVSAGCDRVQVSSGAARADRDAVLVGELLQCRCGAAGFGGDVGQVAEPGQVLLAQPFQVDADGTGVLGGVGGGLLGLGVEAPPDRAQGHGQRVVAQDLAHVVGGDAQ